MKNQKKFQKNTPLKKQQKKEPKNQNNKQKQKLTKKTIYFGKNAIVTETEQYIEITVTYEVIENIGMQEKIIIEQQPE